jgi:hypothetical protein
MANTRLDGWLREIVCDVIGSILVFGNLVDNINRSEVSQQAVFELGKQRRTIWLEVYIG